MNTRSIKFRLVVWYGIILAAAFLVLGAAAYAALHSYLADSLRLGSIHRARQIGVLVAQKANAQKTEDVEGEIEARYAPGLNERFVRVSQKDGSILYISQTPSTLRFMVATLPAPVWPVKAETSRVMDIGDHRGLLVGCEVVKSRDGKQYLIEAGSLMDDLQHTLRQWLTFVVCSFPMLAAVAAAGGYLLVNRALKPVDEIAASAERISSHNLSERLPVPKTRDEIERLSVALNHMIQRLDESFQYSRRFVADASHELRTPLTVLRGEIESFVEQPSLSDEWRDRLGSALEELDRLIKIVERLFAISRLDAGEAQAESVRFDLGELTASTADQMSLLAEDKRIKLSCDVASGVCIQGDRSRMKQVVVNLLDNAIKYTPEGGVVQLKVSSADSKALLEVRDNGAGIPGDALPQIFERFYRVDKARSRELGGAGLGLSIVKSICAAHHGAVSARSVEGRGSTFAVELPLARAVPAASRLIL
jgi:heavy metal sensor kinase